MKQPLVALHHKSRLRLIEPSKQKPVHSRAAQQTQLLLFPELRKNQKTSLAKIDPAQLGGTGQGYVAHQFMKAREVSPVQRLLTHRPGTALLAQRAQRFFELVGRHPAASTWVIYFRQAQLEWRHRQAILDAIFKRTPIQRGAEPHYFWTARKTRLRYGTPQTQ